MKGGTNVDFSPPIDYLLKVFSPTANHFGIQFDCKLIRRYLNYNSFYFLKYQLVDSIVEASILKVVVRSAYQHHRCEP